MNIGGGTGVYNNIPMFWEFENSRSFTNFIREEMFNIILWSHDNHGIKSNLWLSIHIQEDISEEEGWWEWDFIIDCKNIREFKQFEKMTREDIDAFRVERDRDSKLNKILHI